MSEEQAKAAAEAVNTEQEEEVTADISEDDLDGVAGGIRHAALGSIPPEGIIL